MDEYARQRFYDIYREKAMLNGGLNVAGLHVGGSEGGMALYGEGRPRGQLCRKGQIKKGPSGKNRCMEYNSKSYAPIKVMMIRKAVQKSRGLKGLPRVTTAEQWRKVLHEWKQLPKEKREKKKEKASKKVKGSGYEGGYNSGMYVGEYLHPNMGYEGGLSKGQTCVKYGKDINGKKHCIKYTKSEKAPRGKRGTPKQMAAAKTNPWNKFLNEMQIDNPNLTRKDIMEGNNTKQLYDEYLVEHGLPPRGSKKK